MDWIKECLTLCYIIDWMKKASSYSFGFLRNQTWSNLNMNSMLAWPIIRNNLTTIIRTRLNECIKSLNTSLKAEIGIYIAFLDLLWTTTSSVFPWFLCLSSKRMFSHRTKPYLHSWMPTIIQNFWYIFLDFHISELKSLLNSRPKDVI